MLFPFFCTCMPCCWVCSSLTRCGSALLSSITVFWISGFFALLSTILFPRPIFWLLVTRTIHLFVFTQSASLSCARSPASLLASASVSPRERRTHTVFAVWCLGSSRACGGPTSCSPVHVLTVFSSYVFSSVRFLHAVLRVVWLFCASLGTPRCWSLCLESLHSAPFVGLCSARFPVIVHWAALVLRVHVAIRVR